MKIQHIFPLMLIVMDLGAAATYVSVGDWRKVVYWIAAAVLNVVVTF